MCNKLLKNQINYFVYPILFHSGSIQPATFEKLEELFIYFTVIVTLLLMSHHVLHS